MNSDMFPCAPENFHGVGTCGSIHRPHWRHKPFAFGQLIGSGDYGSVYRARWGDQPCAAKTFFLREHELCNIDIQSEIASMQRLRHHNIIQFHGTYQQGDNVYFIMSLAERGNLADAIRSQQLDWHTKTRIAHEVARGLEYLHQEGVLHRDLKSTTVLLSQSMLAKLCDYGFPGVKAASLAKSNAISKCTKRWMAPELLSTTPQFSTKSDVYALGMVMWEMAANCTMPFKEHEVEEDVARLVIDGVRDEFPEATPVGYREWVEQCWAQDPKERPEASEAVVIASIEEIMEDVDSCSISLEAKANVSDADDAFEDNAMSREHELVMPLRSSGHSKHSTLLADNIESETKPKKIEILIRNAEENDVEAQLALAAKYEQGCDGVAKSDLSAFYWYLQAATRGHSTAQFSVAELYFHGRGTPQSYTEAVAWYHKAANQGHAAAQLSMAELYLRGQGVSYDAVEAFYWYRKAAEQGNATAQNNLGTMYQTGTGIKQSYVEAAAWYLKAAQQGDSTSQFNLGLMYEEGKEGIQKDSRRAIEWYRKATAQGHLDAESRLTALLRKPKRMKFIPKWLK